MSRVTYVWDRATGQIVEKWRAGPTSSHAIHSDLPEPLQNPADGRTYSTRRAYDAATRAAGCYELGHTEANRQRERNERRDPYDVGRPVAATIREALARSGH